MGQSKVTDIMWIPEPSESLNTSMEGQAFVQKAIWKKHSTQNVCRPKKRWKELKTCIHYFERTSHTYGIYV